MIETVEWERDFKVLCDGLLRFELGRLVQTFGGSGIDGGVDAEFSGTVDGNAGRWVFQYKFRSSKEALSKRRAWLIQRYRGSKAHSAEFDKEGVKAADGYVLLTNVPVTPAMVTKLRKQWAERGHKGPFCVWDSSRLNALLKGREHLARSWTGAKEARCRQAIILPLWQWIEAALAVSANWMNDPLWPMEVRSHEEILPVPAFQYSLTARHGLRLAPRTAVPSRVARDPQFAYARSVVYPRALEPFDAMCESVLRLAGCVERAVDDFVPVLVRRLKFDTLGHEEPQIMRILAYCVLESRWGFPTRGLHSIKNGQLIAQARYIAWENPALEDIEPVLDELVAEVPRGLVGAEVEAARLAVADILQRLWGRMWHVVSFGTDAETLEGDGA